MTTSRSRPTALVLDDEQEVAESLGRILRRRGYAVTLAHDIASAERLLSQRRFQFAFVDLHLPDGHGADVVQQAMAGGRVDVAYAITGAPQCETVVRAMQCGASTVLEKPFDLEALDNLLRNHAREPSDVLSWRDAHAPNLLGQAPCLVQALEIASQVADSVCTVLITGESGTGKELFARALHAGSPRSEAPFVALNCAAIPETLIEDELFGHARGAFTGAATDRTGHIVSAHRGTLFLDELGDMPLTAQAKLLRVLQDGTITPVGSDDRTTVDVRVIAATNKNLHEMADAGTFRSDLLYRLDVISLAVPPLRERPQDIPSLTRAFIAKSCQRNGRESKTIAAETERALIAHGWPGNVRELENTVERAVLTCPQQTITVRHLGLIDRLRATEERSPEGPPSLDLKAVLRAKERELISIALERSGGNRTEAAALLGLNRTTLVEKLRKVGV